MRKTIVCLLLFSAFAVMLLSSAAAAPLFPDVPEEHWAREAVANLAAKGIIEGFPDGTFKGDRHVTRWEMAIMIQRVLAKMEQEHGKFALKTDVEALDRLTNQLKDELNALGVRTTEIEKNYTELDKRTRELERIRFYGYIQGVMQSNDVYGTLPDAGSRNAPVVDWTNGRLIIEGVGVTNLAKLGTIVRATKNTSFGIEFVGFSSTGDSIINNYWGVTPPVLSNPFTAQGTATPGIQAKNNVPWNKFTLDRFWYRHQPTDTLLTIGSFLNEKTDHMILRGQRNPNIHAPEILPFYGIDLKGNFSRKEGCKWSYEANYSRLPQASFYSSQMTGGTIQYKDEKFKAGVHGLRVNEYASQDGIYYPAGSINAPALPNYPVAPGNAAVYWRDRFGNINNSRLGPQQMMMGGLDLDYKFNKHWNGFVKGAFSNYNPDVTGQIYNNKTTGYSFVAGIKHKSEKLDGDLRYQYTSNNYDPFILQYGGPGSGIPVFLPYSSYYTNYYQLHDYIKYPSNRQGVKLEVGWNITKKTRLQGQYEYLRQVKPSTLANFTTVGNIEPLFPYLQTPGSSVRGHITDGGLTLKHIFSDKFEGLIGYYQYLQKRSTFAADDIDLKEDLAYINLAYKISPAFTLKGDYNYIKYRGHVGFGNTGFKQHIPSISCEAKLNPSTDVGLTYRYYSYTDMILANSDWKAANLTLDWKFKF